MAGIDKTYVDGNEYIEYREWWINNYDKMIKEFGTYIWLYTFTIFNKRHDFNFTPKFLKKNIKDLEHFSKINDFVVWNTSERIDIWLMKNCNIKSFKDRMKDVYPSGWIGFLNM